MQQCGQDLPVPYREVAGSFQAGANRLSMEQEDDVEQAKDIEQADGQPDLSDRGEEAPISSMDTKNATPNVMPV